MTHPAPRSSLDGLPKQFVSAMRTLFDIMDDKKTGFVKFNDIESRWLEDGSVNGLPKGVVESLKKVTPPNGLLSFERFCAGLKICLLRNTGKTEVKTKPTNYTSSNNLVKPPFTLNSVSNNNNNNNNSSAPPTSIVRPQSVPADRLEQQQHGVRLEKPLPMRQNSISHLPSHIVNNPVIRPPNEIAQQRAISMPQLGERAFSSNVNPPMPSEHVTYHSNDPKRNYRFDSHTLIRAKPVQPVAPSHDVPTRRSEILMALHNWQIGLQNNWQSREAEAKSKESIHSNRMPPEIKNIMQDSKHPPLSQDDDIHGFPNKAPAARKLGNRRREPRRHTLANGIDYNMLKRMKQLEQEKDILFQGLNAVDRARDWYLKQIGAVQEKMKYIGKSNTFTEYSIEAHQERLNFQTTRIVEVNHHLSTLVDSSEKGFPVHMNLAIPHPPIHLRQMPPLQDDTIIRRLKEQNHLLTEEVGKKSERITQLEREKSALIRELFQAKAHSRNHVDDTTFM